MTMSRRCSTTWASIRVKIRCIGLRGAARGWENSPGLHERDFDPLRACDPEVGLTVRATGDCSTSEGYAPRSFFLKSPHHLSHMAIKLRLLGAVTDAVRSLTYTPSGVPRLTFGVRVGT